MIVEQRKGDEDTFRVPPMYPRTQCRPTQVIPMHIGERDTPKTSGLDEGLTMGRELGLVVEV